MSFDLSSTQSVRLNPVQELKLAKPAIDLYVGQILKAVVVTGLTENQVTINISGQNINASTAHHFPPGEIMQVKVLQTGEETILQVIPDKASPTLIQTALLQNLPRQASPAQLFAVLSAVENQTSLPFSIRQQINQLLASITPLAQLPRQMEQAISQSGFFLEAALLNARNSNLASRLHNDLQNQYLQLLKTLADLGIKPPEQGAPSLTSSTREQALPLPGNAPQPQAKIDAQGLVQLPLEELLSVLSEQASQVMARIKTCQFSHLLKSEQPYSLMLDLPVRTPEGYETVSLTINEERIPNTWSSKWSMSFAVSLDELGDVQGTVSLNNGVVDVQINANNSTTLQLLSDNQPQFAQLMASHGLTLGAWGLHPGLIEGKQNPNQFSLLDLEI